MKTNREKSNIILFYIGKLISTFGTSIYTFVIGLYVLKLTGSALSFAITLGFGFLATIVVNPISGLMADFYNRKRIVVLMDLSNALLFTVLYLISRSYGLSLSIIYASAFLTTVFTTFFATSLEAAKPNLVSTNRLMNLNSGSKIIDSLALIVGPAIGGIVFVYIDLDGFILINALSFLISAVLEVFIDFEYNISNKAEKGPIGSFSREIREGLGYVFNRRDILGVYSVLISLNFFISFSITVPLPYIINNILFLGSKSYGIIQSSFPLGMILGALLIKLLVDRLSYSRILLYANSMLAMSMILMGIPLVVSFKFTNISYMIIYSFIMLLCGVAISFIDIPIVYIFQKLVPESFRGRVLSISMSIGKIISPIALIISGLLLGSLEPYIIPILGGFMLIIINSLILRFGEIVDISRANKYYIEDEGESIL